MLAVAGVPPWIGVSSAQTVPDLDCTWKGTCNQPSKADEERRRRLLEEQRRKTEEERRRTDEQRKADEERRRADEERRRAADEERRRADEERRRATDEERRRTDEQRKADEERRRADEQRRADEERRRADEQRKADEERRRTDEERRRAADEERRRTEEERRRAADEERRRVDEERRRAADEERRRTDEQRRAAEERRRLDEERRKAGDEQRGADRKRQEGELLAALRRGDPNDVLLFVNETASAPNASRSQGQVVFRGGQAAVCGVTPWTGGPEVSAAVQAVLARHGATRLLTNVAETACPEIQRPYDIVAVERRQFQELSAANVRGLVTDVLDRRLTLLEPGVTAADIAAARERLRPSLTERRRQLGPTVNPLAERLVAEVQAYIAADGRSGTIGTEFAAFGHWYGQLRGANRAPAVERFEIDDYGDATGAGGGLPAASVVVWFNVTAPGRPAPMEDCMIFAWLDDSASGVRREPIAFRCDAVSEIDQWKRQRGLRSKWS